MGDFSSKHHQVEIQEETSAMDHMRISVIET